jgi:hypothetical protein
MKISSKKNSNFVEALSFKKNSNADLDLVNIKNNDINSNNNQKYKI